MAVNKVVDSLVQLTTSDRTLEEKLGDLVSASDYGATVAGLAAANTAAINLAIVAASVSGAGGFVLVAPGISYTEASLVIPDDVTVIVIGAFGTVTFLVKDQGDSPIAKGGIGIKSQGRTGVLLRAVDLGVSGEPLVQVVDGTNGDIAAMHTKFIELDEHASVTAPSANKARIFSKDDGSGNTQLAIAFATGEQVALVSQGQKTNLVGTVVWDPASVAKGNHVETSVTVTGAVVGDLCLVSANLDLQGLQLSAYVQAANTVDVTLYNNTAGAVDLGSGTYKVLVLRNW